MATAQEKQNTRDLRRDKQSVNFSFFSNSQSNEGGGGGYYADGSSKESGNVDDQGYAKKIAMPDGGQAPNELAQVKQWDLAQEARLELNSDKAAQTDGSSGVSVDDQTAMRRRLNSDRLQTRNEQDQSQVAESGQAQTAVEADKSQGRSIRGQWQKIKNERQQRLKKLKGLSGKMDPSSQAFAQMNQQANRAIKKAWTQAHVYVEELLYDIFYLAFLFAVPYLLLCAGRLIVGMIGMLKIKIKKVEVNLVPMYSLKNGAMTLLNNLIFLGISAIEWVLIAIIIRAIWKPLETVWDLSLFGIIWNWFF